MMTPDVLLSTASIDTNESSTNDNPKVKKSQLLILEPAVLLLFFAWNLSGSVFTNQIVFQSCTAALGFNQTECKYLGSSNESEEVKELEQIIQPYAANILMAKTLIESIIPAITSLFIGPWSDKYGRKPIMLATFSGYFFTYTIISIICFASQYILINPWYYVFAFLPAAISGGNCTLITGIFCYIADVTNDQNRAVKMGVLEAVLFLGLLLGSLSSSYLLALTSATSVFLIATISILLGLVYIIFYIKESVIIHNELFEGSKVRELFKFELVKDMCRTCFKVRPNYDRLIMWLTICSLAAMIFAMQGSATVFFLFVREKFEWTVKDFSFLESSSIVILIFGNLIGLYVIKRLFKLSDTVLGMIALLSCMIDSSIKAMAVQPFHLYLAVSVSFLRGVAGPMSRAILSSVVNKEDIGKVFSLTTSIETITTLVSAPLYTLVYESTIKFYPGAFNIISVAVHFMCLAFLTIVYILQNMYHNVTYASIN